MIISQQVCEKHSDKELIGLSINNLDYFSCLFDRYESKLLRYIHRITSIDENTANDILQEAFIKIWKNLYDFDSSLKFSSWIYRVVHNETISYWRKSKSYGKDHVVDPDFHLKNEPDHQYESDNEQELQIAIVLKELKEDYRTILILKFLEQKSYDEISDILKIPEGTVATRINRAKKAFRAVVQKRGIHFEF